MALVAKTVNRRTADRVQDAVLRELQQHYTYLNTVPGIRSVNINVKMKNGTGIPRAVLVSIETESNLADTKPVDTENDLDHS